MFELGLQRPHHPGPLCHHRHRALPQPSSYGCLRGHTRALEGVSRRERRVYSAEAALLTWAGFGDLQVAPTEDASGAGLGVESAQVCQEVAECPAGVRGLCRGINECVCLLWGEAEC